MPTALLLLALAQPADRVALDPDRLVFRGIEDDAPVRGEAENPLEFEAYNTVLLHAHGVRPDELLAVADRTVRFRDLVLPVRQDYRLKLVGVDGRLHRLRKYPAPKPLADAGVPHLYEGWLFPDDASDPLCFLGTALPAGLEPSHRFSPTVPVTAAGFVFKLMRYEATEKHPADPARHRVRKAPLLMGNALLLRPGSAGAADPWAGVFVPGLLLAVGLLAVAGVGLSAFFRRGDRAAKRHITARQAQNPFAEPADAGRGPLP